MKLRENLSTPLSSGTPPKWQPPFQIAEPETLPISNSEIVKPPLNLGDGRNYGYTFLLLRSYHQSVYYMHLLFHDSPEGYNITGKHPIQ